MNEDGWRPGSCAAVGVSCPLRGTAGCGREDFNLIPSYVEFSGAKVENVTKVMG